MIDDLRALLTPEAISERLEHNQRLIDEEAAARELAARLLTGPPSWWENKLRNEAGSRTAGMVKVLLERARELGNRSPAEALIVADVAGNIARDLGSSDYLYDHVYHLRGAAQRDIAWFLTLLGRSDEAALKAAYAEDLFRSTPTPLVDLARLDIVRATLARDTEKPDEAIARARSAAETFLWFGDRKRWVHACDIEATVHYGVHDYRRALEVWERTREYLEPLDDAFRAGVLHNIAMCQREMGALEEAAEAFQHAAAVFAKAGMHLAHTAAKFNLGVTLTMAGQYHEAVPLVRAAWREYESLGMKPYATLAALRLVEALMITDPKEVPAICRHLLDWCIRSGMTKSAMTAIAFLRETVAVGHATPASVRQIHDVLHAKQRNESLFASD